MDNTPAFMQPEIYFGGYFQVETTSGTEVVPGYQFSRTASTHVDALLNYLEGHPLDTEELIEPSEGWLARMSASGYLDCSDWTVHKSKELASAYLEDMFGDDTPVVPQTEHA